MNPSREPMTRLRDTVKAIGVRGLYGRLRLMPAPPRANALPELTDAQRRCADRLRQTVEHLAITIGARNVAHPQAYRAAELSLTEQMKSTGGAHARQSFVVSGVECANIIFEFPGRDRADEIVVIGAHYDSVELTGSTSRETNCPAANDNASGCAAVVELAARLSAQPHARTLRFVLFANEEPPYFWTDTMGSLVYANACRQKNEKIVAMLTPETIGCYSDEPGTQRYPIPVVKKLGDRGDFIAFAGMSSASDLLKRCVNRFRAACPVRCMGAAAPAAVPMIGASDHWGFWKNGYPALMVTDTAPFRFAHYHTSQDTPEKLNYDMMARVVDGLENVIIHLAND